MARGASPTTRSGDGSAPLGVFCAPSLRGESFGVVLLEAMAAGAAIVASDLSGYRLVARPDVDGLLVPPGEVEALAGALRTVLADPVRRSALVASGSSGLGPSRWTCWPTATSSSTSGSSSPWRLAAAASAAQGRGTAAP
ncbi:MAG: glycosyltransferase [Acidimicrobiales bacterium]